MWFRSIGVCVIAFWAVMTALLLRAVYFPAYERLPKVDPGHVLELFLEHRDVTHLFSYRDGKVVGDIMLTTQQFPNKDGRAKIGFAAAGAVELPNLPKQKLNWRGAVTLGSKPGRKLQKIEFSVRFTNPALTVGVEIDPATMAFGYKVTQGGQVITDSTTEASPMGVAQMQMLMMAWGINLSHAKGDGARWDARQGAVEIAGHRAGAYFVVMEMPGMGKAKLTFSEAGELLVVETPLGYEMLTEAMRQPPHPLPYQ